MTVRRVIMFSGHHKKHARLLSIPYQVCLLKTR